MTSKERTFRAIRHEQHEVPYEMRMEPVVADRLDSHYGTAGWRNFVDNDVRRVKAYNCWGWQESHSSEILRRDVYGCLWRTYGSFWRGDVGGAPSLEKAAIISDDLHSYTFPDVEAFFPPKWRQHAQETIQQYQDYFLTTSIDFGIYDRTLMLCGHERGFMEMAADDGAIVELLDCVTDHFLEVIDVLATLDVDGIFIGDDWGDQRGIIIGASRWRRLVKPRTAQLIERIHQSDKIALYHSCGNISEILPDLIEIKLDVIESIQPEAMDPYELKRKYGDKMTFWGGLGSQSLMPFGTPEEVKAETRRLSKRMGQGGGYILGPTKTLQIDTPTANAAAAVEAFIESRQGCLPDGWPCHVATNH